MFQLKVCHKFKTWASYFRQTPEPTTGTTNSLQQKSYEIDVDNEELQRKEEEQHKKSLFLYVFILRCIAYPFNSKQPTDMARRLCKVTPQQLDVIKDRFSAFLGGNSNIVADEAFFNAVQSYFEVFIRSPRIARMVESGGATAADFRDVFKNNIEKRIKNLPEIDGLSKETVLNSWMGKFDAIYFGEDENTLGIDFNINAIGLAQF